MVRLFAMTPETKRPEFVLITGAAGGIGSAAAARFGADGARVAITDIDADRLAAVAAATGALSLPADGTDREAVAAVVAAAVAEFGALDALVATQGATSAGTAGPKGDDAWFKALDINLSGAYLISGEAAPHLVARRGSIVLIASTAGFLAGPPGTVGYTAAKSGLIGLMRYLARELGPKGVRVNSVSPGWVETQLGQDAMDYLAAREGITPEEAYRLATGSIPLRRASRPADIAAVCAFLVSSDAAMVTGHNLVADGGGSVMDAGTAMFDPPN
jgi:meso-butanediol dehydrogenase / (S,S)-butanediol dehydrogenase / diacetyl reductase